MTSEVIWYFHNTLFCLSAKSLLLELKFAESDCVYSSLLSSVTLFLFLLESGQKFMGISSRRQRHVQLQKVKLPSGLSTLLPTFSLFLLLSGNTCIFSIPCCCFLLHLPSPCTHEGPFQLPGSHPKDSWLPVSRGSLSQLGSPRTPSRRSHCR